MATPRAVQCSTGPFWAFELERAFELLAEAGFTEIELMVTRDPATQSPGVPARLAERYGLRIASVHGPFLVISKSVWSMDPLEKIRRGVDMCLELGAETFVVHPPFLWERAYARWLAEDAARQHAETGVIVAVETMYPKWVAGRRLRGYRWLDPAELTAACPHVAMDTSHLTVARHDVIDAYRKMRGRLVHIHLSNNAGDGRDGHLDLEQGVVPVERLLAELVRDNYTGAVCLELAVRRYLQRPRELVEMLRRNRLMVEQGLQPRRRIAKGMPRPDLT